MDISDAFWNLSREKYGYYDNNPSIEKFLIIFTYYLYIYPDSKEIYQKPGKNFYLKRRMIMKFLLII